MAHVHHHDATLTRRAFAWGIGLNTAFVIVEAGAGLLYDSMALLSDAAHNLGDVLALVLAAAAFRLAEAKPTERRTYGLKRATILASVISAALLCVALGAVGWEAFGRFGAAHSTRGDLVMAVALVGVLVNGATALMFMRGRAHDLNVRSAFLHMVADASVSLGVAIGGAVILFTGWDWVDPAIAIVVAALILLSAIALLRESLDLAMDAVPRHVDAGAVRGYLAGLPGVEDVHDLHIWGMSTTETALTVHLVVRDGESGDDFLHGLSETLRTRFRIDHPTVQIESGASEAGCVVSAVDCQPPVRA